MRLLKPNASGVLYSCLWIVITFASSPEGNGGPSKNQGRLSRKGIWVNRCKELMTIFDDVKLVPRGLDKLIADYDERLFFLHKPRLILEHPHTIHGAFLDDRTVFGGYDVKAKGYATESYNLLDIKGAMVALPPSGIRVAGNFAGFGTYPGMHVFALYDGGVVLKRTADDGGKRVLTLPSRFIDSHNIKMAPSMSSNGLVWLCDGRIMVLVNVAHMVRTNAENVLSYRYVNFRIKSPSLNKAGTVLAHLDHNHDVKILRVQCCSSGEIKVTEVLTIPGPKASSVMILKDDIIAINKGGLYAFYDINMEQKTIKKLHEKFDSATFHSFRYHEAEDLVVAYRLLGRKRDQGFVQVEEFFRSTRILIFDPCALDWNDETFIVSPNLRYLLKKSTGHKTVNGLGNPCRSCVYRISVNMEQD